MKAYALLCKRTANIMEGHEICFFRNSGMIETDTPYSIGLSVFKCDGWIIYHPETGPFSYYFSLEGVEQFFEILGEL